MNIFDKIPNFGFSADANRGQRRARPDIIDVESQEVKTSCDKPEDDKVAREEQIVAEAFSRSENIMAKSPIAAILNTIIWIEGAKWADEHRLSAYPTRQDWTSAGRDALHKLLREISEDVLQDPLLTSGLFLTFCVGALWAEEHPANV